MDILKKIFGEEEGGQMKIDTSKLNGCKDKLKRILDC